MAYQQGKRDIEIKKSKLQNTKSEDIKKTKTHKFFFKKKKETQMNPLLKNKTKQKVYMSQVLQDTPSYVTVLSSDGHPWRVSWVYLCLVLYVFDFVYLYLIFLLQMLFFLIQPRR